MTAATPTPPSSWVILRLVTLREIRARGGSKAYQLSGLLIVAILTAAVVLPNVLSSRAVNVRVGTLGADSAEVVGLARDITAGRLAGTDRELDYHITPFADIERARTALADGDVEFVVIDGASILRQGSSGFSGSDAERTVQEAAAQLALRGELGGSNETAAMVAELLRSDPLLVEAVRGAADEAETQARSLIAYSGMMLLYMAILLYGAWTLQGVTEEKSSRVVEVLLSSVRPWQLMAGKVLGVGLLGLGQFVLTVGWALALIRLTDTFPLPAVPVDSAVTLVIWFVLGYALYSVLFAAGGALAGRMEDAQTVTFPVSLIAIIGFFLSFRVLDDPAGTMAQVTTYVPFMSPFVVPIRVAYGEIGVLEQVGAALVSVGVTVGLLRVAGRLYAGGLLHFGSRMGVRAAWRSAESG